MITIRKFNSPVFSGVTCLMAFLTILLLNQCAVRQSPQGGPEDKTPPQLLETFPTADSTNVLEASFIEFVFDENLERSSLANQIGIIPEVPDGFDIQWKGNRRFRLLLKGALAANQTYLVNIGTGLKDWRKNELAEPVVLPFSTGPVIDRGSVAGRVFDKSPEGIFIQAFPDHDSLQGNFPFGQSATYYSQVNKKGEFTLGYLKPGTYWVYALKDNNRNRKYDIGIDEVAIPNQPVTLDSSQLSHGNLYFRMVEEDSTSPGLLRARFNYDNQLSLSFSEDVKLTDSLQVSLTDSVSAQKVAIIGYWPDESDQSVIWLATLPQSSKRYLGVISGLEDLQGNKTDSSLAFSVSSSEKSDTTQFKLETLYPNPASGPAAFTDSILLKFSQPVDPLTVQKEIQILDSSGVEISGTWHFNNLRTPFFRPGNPLKAGVPIRLTMQMSQIQNCWGGRGADTLITHQFSVWSLDDLGEISGIVHSADSAQGQVIAINYQNKKRYQNVFQNGKTFTLRHIPAGQYQIEAFIDLNRNNKFDPGKTLPFQLAEPFRVLSDTVKVRKRWTTEGLNVNFEQSK